MPRTPALPDSYDADRPLAMRCACGRAHDVGEHGAGDAAAATASASGPLISRSASKPRSSARSSRANRCGAAS